MEQVGGREEKSDRSLEKEARKKERRSVIRSWSRRKGGSLRRDGYC